MTQIKTKLSLVFTIALCFASSVDAATIASVETKDADTLKVSFSETVSLSDAPTGEIKVLKDVAVDSATKDLKDSKVINITLSGELSADMSYSLISIFGAEGSMDFSLGAQMANVEIKNADSTSTIDKIVVVDSKKLDIHYKTDVTGAEFEYKILSGLGVSSLGVDMDGGLILKVTSPFESKKDYILMIVSLKDDAGKEVTIDDGIFDFTSTEMTPAVAEAVAPIVPPTAPDAGTGTSMPAALPAPGTETPIIPGTTTDTSAADAGNVEEVALNAGSTPDTGAETWVLILGTLLINGFVYLYRRKA